MNTRIYWTKRGRTEEVRNNIRVGGTKEGKNREKETRKWEDGKKGKREEQIDRNQINKGKNRLKER